VQLRQLWDNSAAFHDRLVKGVAAPQRCWFGDLIHACCARDWPKSRLCAGDTRHNINVVQRDGRSISFATGRFRGHIAVMTAFHPVNET